ncbi:MAG TPA: hypothetical protein DDX98_09990 [Bacteroidales bacterium]|jgi:ubiquinone/menaquinone biosynthesis C-methylase UbiE|nr:hypothetical protein [Bacteroidales bacterium]
MSFSSFFSHVQESPWYGAFLSPVLDQITHGSKVLDVGTATGKLIQMLVREKSTDCTGVDIDESMLKEARRKLDGVPSTLKQIDTQADFPFQDECFDHVCICNVLFNLDMKNRDRLLSKCHRVLKRNGKIVVLSPTGMGKLSILASRFVMRGNKTIGLWYLLTRKNARSWSTGNYLEDYCKSRQLTYARTVVFDGLGLVETLEKK